MSVSAWVVGGALTMYVMGLAIAKEMEDFPGGGRALAAIVMPGAQAMRLMRWPAERIDTLGGYLTYHNITLFSLLIAIYAAVQGARAVRGDEDRHSLEEVLATGWSRRAVIRDRAVGFALLLSMICIGLALGTEAALASGHASDLGGSLVTFGVLGLCAMVAYSLGLLVSQLVPTARAAAGMSALILTALYVCTNVWDELGIAGVIRFVSPFYYFGFSRALVPGHGFDAPASAALVLMSVALLALAVVAFERRDYASALWTRRRKGRRSAAGASRATQRVVGAVWKATFLRGRYGLLAWSISAGAVVFLMMLLKPSVMDAWSLFSKYMPGARGTEGAYSETMYVAFSAEIIAPIVAAYVIVQAAGWVGDLAQGRVEEVLAAPVSWSRLVWERLLASSVGVACIAAAAVTALSAGAIAVDVEIDPGGLGRLALATVLLGAALAAVAAIAVAGIRSGVAITVLGVFVGASYLLGYIRPIFEWPDWVSRLNVFSLYGHPYAEWPAIGDVAVLVAMALLGGLLAVAIAQRTPKVAT